MVQDSGHIEVHVPPAGRAQALPAAIGMHIGLGIVCGSAIYTAWQTAIVSYAQWAVMLALGAALVAAGVIGYRRAGLLRRTPTRSALAMGGLLAFSLCYDPQLEAIPRLGEDLPETFLATYPSIALIGVVIAFISWLAYRSTGGEVGLGVIPFRRSSVVAVGMVWALAMVMCLLLRGAHDLPAGDSLRPVLVALQAGGLVVTLLGIGGGPAVRGAPHIYIGLALILAFARNMAFPME